MYSRKQFGTGVFLTLLAAGVVTGIALFFLPATDFSRTAFSIPVVLVVVALLFMSLKVEVTTDALKLTYGIGLIRKSFPLAEITACQAVRNKWWYGFGIRLTPHGWMFNIAGLDAVEITLESGKKYRIGTADPSGLNEALSRSIAS